MEDKLKELYSKECPSSKKSPFLTIPDKKLDIKDHHNSEHKSGFMNWFNEDLLTLGIKFVLVSIYLSIFFILCND